MKSLKIVVAVGALMLPFTYVATSAVAATAHNSQAGAMGQTTNDDAPTKGPSRMKMKRHMSKHMMKKAM